MLDFFNTVIVLLAICGIWLGGNTYMRVSDLNKQFELTLEELLRDEYVVTETDEGGVQTTLLTNPTSRIHYRRTSDCEELSISLFFRDSEKSGANNTRVARPRGERRKFTRTRSPGIAEGNPIARHTSGIPSIRTSSSRSTTASADSRPSWRMYFRHQ